MPLRLGRAAGNTIECSTLLQNAILTGEKIDPEQRLLLTKTTLPARLREPVRLATGENATPDALYLGP